MKSGIGFVVVGGDCLVGAGLIAALRRRGHETLASTRRVDRLGVGRIFVDLETEATFRVPAGHGYAFIVAAVTDYERCEHDPLARRTNVELIPRCAASLLEQGCFVTYVSTNSVFGGERPWPREEDPMDPQVPYARHKAEAEAALICAADRLSASERLNIVRLTKIMGRETSPLPDWFSAWESGRPVQPFTDHVIAPMSARFAGEALATIGESRLNGKLHLSGARNITYLDLALALAARLGIAPALVEPTTSQSKGVNLSLRLRYSGLSMEHTTHRTGLAPQPLESVVEDLVTSGTIYGR